MDYSLTGDSKLPFIVNDCVSFNHLMTIERLSTLLGGFNIMLRWIGVENNKTISLF